MSLMVYNIICELWYEYRVLCVSLMSYNIVMRVMVLILSILCKLEGLQYCM